MLFYKISLNLGEIQLQDDNSYVLRKNFIADKDDIIFKILMNYFKAASTAFSVEWNDSKNYTWIIFTIWLKYAILDLL